MTTASPSATPSGLPPELPADLVVALDRAAAGVRLLVVSDVDGTLAPFVDDPAAARPEPAGVQALEALAGRPGTLVAMLSGRALDSLRAVTGSPAGVELVGSHGAESSAGMAPLTDAEQALLARLDAALTELVGPVDGAHVESKPTARVLHVRPVPDPDTRERLLDAARSGPASWDGVTATEGKGVVELAVREAGKGHAIAALVERHHPDVTVFLGDDVTDEHAFAVLGAGDVGVKVGEGATRAGYRVADIPAVVRALQHLAAGR